MDKIFLRIGAGERTTGGTGMTEREKMIAGANYDALDAELLTARLRTQDLCHALARTLPSDLATRERILKELLPHAAPDRSITPPFHCDYGWNIHIGAKFYCNTGCVILDGTPVRIGEHVLLGPNVQIYTARHPLAPDLRATGIESAAPVTIGDKVWIGGSAVILPGVSIGEGAVVGAGSVVTKDVAPQTIVAGAPAHLISNIDDQARQ